MRSYQPADLQQSDAAIRRRPLKPTPAADARPRPHELVRLQGQVGNAQVARMLAQRQAPPEEEEELLQAKHDPALVGRQVPEEEEEPIQAKGDPALQNTAAPVVGLEGGPVGEDLARRIETQRGSGSGLDQAVRAPMESAFGADFGDVRVHQDPEADTLARSMTARAFTTGADIFLRKDASPADSSLIAHELTHVVQQSAGVEGAAGGGGMTVGAADDRLEQQADEVARSVTSGAGAQRQLDEARPT